MRTLSLHKFCSTDESRGPLLKPWRDGDFTYASDGRIIVRVASELEDFSHPHAPSVAQLDKYFGIFGNGSGALLWRKVPELPEVTFEECDTCKGDVHECCCGHQHECCACEGTGKVEIDAFLDIGPARFNCYYLRLIAELPSLEISIIAELEPMLFRFDGGVGVLMPMRKDVPYAEKVSKP